MFLDARIAVRLVSPEDLAEAFAANPGAALLVEDGLPAPEGAERFAPVAVHVAGCACCGNRTAAAAALDRLFLARVKGSRPLFTMVLAAATEAGRADIAAALERDPVVPMRYRAG
jgi:hypothetical protein